MPQYFKLRKKAQAGARFVIKQIGWNARKDDELLRWIRREGLDLAVLSNVYLLSRVAARAFHRGLIPGVVVTDELLALVERHAASPDNGRAFFVDLAAKHVAVARGLGFDGVYLGGHMPAATFGEILDLASSFGPDDWREFARELDFPLEDEFYFFERDPETGLSSDEVSATYLDSKRTAAHRAARSALVPLQPARPRRRLRRGRAALRRRAVVLREGRPRSQAGAQGGACARAGREGPALRLQGLRRLLARRDRLRLPRVAVREEPAQRAVRGHAGRSLRGLRHGVHLVAGLRAPEGLRRGGVDARRAGRGQGQRPRRDERVGEHVPRPRPPGPRKARSRGGSGTE